MRRFGKFLACASGWYRFAVSLQYTTASSQSRLVCIPAGGYDSAPDGAIKSTAEYATMGRIFFLVAGFFLGGAVIFGAFNYHLLKTKDGLELVPKQSAHLSETYVDIRSFTASDWTKHPDLAADIAAAEKHHLLGQSAEKTIEDGVKKFLNEIRQ
jgi:hypothetical protein